MMEANVSGAGLVGERFAGEERPDMGDNKGLRLSEGSSPWTRLLDREWPLDREVAVPGRRNAGGDGLNGGGVTWTRVAGTL